MNVIDITKKYSTRLLPMLNQFSNSLYKIEVETAITELNLKDRSDLHFLQELRELLDQLGSKIKLLESPILAEGSLHKNNSGRYQIDDNNYFTSGSPIEILYFNEYFEQTFWVRTRIEHNGDDYYAVAIPDIPLSNLQARVRE